MANATCISGIIVGENHIEALFLKEIKKANTELIQLVSPEVILWEDLDSEHYYNHSVRQILKTDDDTPIQNPVFCREVQTVFSSSLSENKGL